MLKIYLTNIKTKNMEIILLTYSIFITLYCFFIIHNKNKEIEDLELAKDFYTKFFVDLQKKKKIKPLKIEEVGKE